MVNWSAKHARQSRKVTTALLEAVDNGLISWEQLARRCMDYMSEHDVAQMADTYNLNEVIGIIDEEEEEDEQ